MTENSFRHWELQSNVERSTFGLFIECVADIAESIELFNETCLQRNPHVRSFQRPARQTSVAIRKLLFDGGGYLFKQCVQPRLHPLQPPVVPARPDVLVERLEGMSISYTDDESTELQTYRAPAYEHRTVVNPLYGLRRTGEKQYQLATLFDLAGQPVKLKRWLKFKVLQVDDVVLNAERLLRLLVNFEGAHLDANQMIRHHESTPVNMKLPDLEDERYRRATWITFGGVSYLHIFTLLVGDYLLRMTKTTLKHCAKEFSNFPLTQYLAEPFMKSPVQIASTSLPLDEKFEIGLVFQSTDNSFELVGDVGNIGVTTFQIPGGS